MFSNYTNEELKININILMNYLDIPRGLKGYSFLSEAIEIVYYKPDSIHNAVKELYTEIGKRHKVAVDCVERDMRTAIKCTRNMQGLAENFKCMEQLNKYPTCREFIAMFAEKLKRNLLSYPREFECYINGYVLPSNIGIK